MRIVGKRLREALVESGKPTIDIRVLIRRGAPKEHWMAVLYRYNGEGECIFADAHQQKRQYVQNICFGEVKARLHPTNIDQIQRRA
jgi:hypothetical protein